MGNPRIATYAQRRSGDLACIVYFSISFIRIGMTLCRGNGNIPLNDPGHQSSKHLVRLLSGFLPKRIPRGQLLTLLIYCISKGLTPISTHLELFFFLLDKICLEAVYWLTNFNAFTTICFKQCGSISRPEGLLLSIILRPEGLL